MATWSGPRGRGTTWSGATRTWVQLVLSDEVGGPRDRGPRNRRTAGSRATLSRVEVIGCCVGSSWVSRGGHVGGTWGSRGGHLVEGPKGRGPRGGQVVGGPSCRETTWLPRGRPRGGHVGATWSGTMWLGVQMVGSHVDPRDRVHVVGIHVVGGPNSREPCGAEWEPRGVHVEATGGPRSVPCRGHIRTTLSPRGCQVKVTWGTRGRWPRCRVIT